MEVMTVNVPKFNISSIPTPIDSYTYAGLFNSNLKNAPTLLHSISKSKFVYSIISEHNEIISTKAYKSLLKQCDKCLLDVLSNSSDVGHIDILFYKPLIHMIQQFINEHVPIMLPSK
jgi:hypothetical protein